MYHEVFFGGYSLFNSNNNNNTFLTVLSSFVRYEYTFSVHLSFLPLQCIPPSNHMQPMGVDKKPLRHFFSVRYNFLKTKKTMLSINNGDFSFVSEVAAIEAYIIIIKIVLYYPFLPHISTWLKTTTKYFFKGFFIKEKDTSPFFFVRA